ncbi:MAG: potassium channel family protein [Rhodospirillaceae bacterium]|nr:potassium channel family protein [Rhodospirillales bacterium]
MERLRERLCELYRGTSPRAAAFQYALLAFDLAIIAFFVAVSFLDPDQPVIVAVDLVLAVILALDYAARLWTADVKWRFIFRLGPLSDLVVIATLLVPALTESYAFLRVMRALRVLRSYHVLGVARRRSHWVALHEEVIAAFINLLVFIFIVTALVYVTQARTNPKIGNYVDALYFTVTTLTTTGYGDITLDTTFGRLLAVIIMVVGISLFVRLAQAVFRPRKVLFPCPSCGLQRHDPDAVHCKHCGRVLNIPDEGYD